MVYVVGEVIGEGLENIPVIIDKSGNAKPLTVDDKYAIVIYHLLNNITTIKNTRVAYGDSTGEIKNTISGSLIVFSDTGKIKMTTDELFLFLQANWPETLTVTPYSGVKTLINNVILNSRQVWSSQYGIPYGLKLNQHLMQVNYTIESAHKQGCFVNCPEEYCNTN
jgi:hypothetical protein